MHYCYVHMVLVLLDPLVQLRNDVYIYLHIHKCQKPYLVIISECHLSIGFKIYCWWFLNYANRQTTGTSFDSLERWGLTTQLTFQLPEITLLVGLVILFWERQDHEIFMKAQVN